MRPNLVSNRISRHTKLTVFCGHVPLLLPWYPPHSSFLTIWVGRLANKLHKLALGLVARWDYNGPAVAVPQQVDPVDARDAVLGTVSGGKVVVRDHARVGANQIVVLESVAKALPNAPDVEGQVCDTKIPLAGV